MSSPQVAKVDMSPQVVHVLNCAQNRMRMHRALPCTRSSLEYTAFVRRAPQFLPTSPLRFQVKMCRWQTCSCEDLQKEVTELRQEVRELRGAMNVRAVTLGVVLAHLPEVKKFVRRCLARPA